MATYRVSVVCAALALIASGTGASAAGSDDVPPAKAKRVHHARSANPPAKTLGAALADPNPVVQPMRRALTAVPANQSEPSWTGFHVGVGLGGAR